MPLAETASTERADTVPKLLLRNGRIHRDRKAYLEKDRGIWHAWTWGETLDEIRALSLGLYVKGLERGQSIAIIGNNRPQLYWTFCAAQALGAIPVPLYQDAVADEMAHVLKDAGVVMAVVEDQEQVDKLIEIAERIPILRTIIYEDPRGLQKYDATRLHSFADIQALGRAELKREPKIDAWWRDEIGKGQGSDLSVILYTSGTTGRSKGVELSHDNIVRSGSNANLFDHFTPDDSMIAFLPMAWVGDHIFTYGQVFASALSVACPESPETILEDRREFGPTYFFAPPRVFENMLTLTMVRMEDAGRLKRLMFNYFLKVARRSGEKILDGEPVGLIDRALYGLGEIFVYGPLRNRFGFSKVRVAYTAGEAIGPELFSFFRSLGINLKQLYGMTEASVFVTLQPDGEVYPETVGKPGPEVEIRITDSGEVQFKSPGAFQRYHNNEAATAEAKTADGFVKTGDAGFIDPRGHLVIIDRAKDVGKLKSGAMFAPKYIENRAKFFPEIKEAVAFGDGRDFVTLFVNIDPVSVGNWAERHNVAYASYQELAANPEVEKLIRGRIDELNRRLADEPRTRDSQVRRFLILPKELDADDGELTRTQKVRRGFIADRYLPLVDALFSGAKVGSIKVEVTFEDGRKGTIEGACRIVDMPAYNLPPVRNSPIREAAE